MSGVENSSVLEMHLVMIKQSKLKTKHLFYPSNEGGREKEGIPLQNTNDTEVFNVTTMFHSWRSKVNLKWNIMIDMCHGKTSNSTCKSIISELFLKKKTRKDSPFLVMFYSNTEQDLTSQEASRAMFPPVQGRRFPRRGRGQRAWHCGMVTLWVNFKQIKWTHIIHPKQANLGYCHGNCSRSLRSYSLHAKALDQVKRLPGSAGMMDKSQLEPCCAPAKMQGLRVLARILTQQIESQFLKKLVVSTCGCL